MAKDWKQSEIWNGTYTFDDLLDWHEMTQVKTENQRMYQEFLKANPTQSD
jgi:hypothetical protein